MHPPVHSAAAASKEGLDISSSALWAAGQRHQKRPPSRPVVLISKLELAAARENGLVVVVVVLYISASATRFCRLGH